ncbi:amino acid/amide ABC transporter membrane protein 1, HAAT family /amino acid/amide ABC transporter membrane protein 2, HAAT family [Paraburkholderia steynii]|uniref:Amino acid/amide ABC transporter membrane protein 1, HAAT family /amino acid/amide ABC transporter membrane protein 2, HAAT family n=1 Tax=Paraburkholderia steynii TaxID=1245441 RepID=A0A7Z7FH25_9BURK|nr:ABC transporter permease [Paraburkholderia steynii]SDH83511.1 amino acid/amide ABC transporter membrane protein 1, HAAT family /amino acid/amide ABC transporter membrane protein 2, HAAT family [Paraburkholderia steynii]
MLPNLLVQLINGLADASALFLVAAGLSLIFGVTRIVNFAHGSFYMLGVYVAYSIASRFGTSSVIGFWLSMLASAFVIGILGALVEFIVLRRIYKAPELFHLLATFALVLIFRDAALAIWGPQDLFGPRAPHLSSAVELLGHQLPTWDIVLIVIGPLVLLLLWYALTRTRWGTLVRAATQDREMLGALGINQAWLFTGVFFVGAFLAGLGGALQGPRMSANLSLDLETIGNAFVVVVVGGMGSIPGAFIAALLIAEIKALCIGIGHVSLFGVDLSLSRFTLVAEFVVMAVVLVVRPWGLLGRATSAVRAAAPADMPLKPAGRPLKWLAACVLAVLVLAPLAAGAFPYMPVLLVEILIAVLFAASLHFIMGPGGMHSFGHAAYFGLGAYGAALFLKVLDLPMEAALVLGPLLAVLGALVFGWFCVRLSGVYLAMLTLAFAQIVWSVVYQWDDVTGGSNGILGLWPSNWLSSPVAYYYLTLACAVLGVWLLRRMLFSPLGFAMRASRDSALRAEAIGIDTKRVQWAAFVIASLFCGLAGSLYAFSKGTISPEVISVSRSVDGLVMVLLGGIQTLTGPVAGAALFTWLQDTVARQTDYWQALLGIAILLLVIAFPQGIVGFMRERFERDEAQAGGGQ